MISGHDTRKMPLKTHMHPKQVSKYIKANLTNEKGQNRQSHWKF